MWAPSPVVWRWKSALETPKAAKTPAETSAMDSPHPGGGALRESSGRHESAQGLDDGIVGGPFRLCSGLSEAGDRGVDDVGFDLFDVLEGQAELRSDPRPEVLDHHIAGADEVKQLRMLLGILEIGLDGAFAPVERREIRRSRVGEGTQVTGVITVARHFDLEDLGALIGEHGGGIEAGQHAREVCDPDPVE